MCGRLVSGREGSEEGLCQSVGAQGRCRERIRAGEQNLREREESAFVFEYARKWEGVNEDAARRAVQGRSWNMGRYQTLIQRLAIVMAFLLMLMAYGKQ